MDNPVHRGDRHIRRRHDRWYMSALIHPQQRAVLHLVGYLVKIPVFFLIGVLWAKLHSSERNLLKIYQLGIVAPAIITGSIAASRLQSATNTAPAPVVSIPSASSDGKQNGLLRSTKQDQTGSVLSVQYVTDNLRRTNPEGVAATPVVRRSPSLTISDIFRDLRNGFLDRPPDRLLACSNLPVLAYIPNSSKAVILEGKSSCQILVDFSQSPDDFSTAACRDFNATLLSSRFSVSVSDGNGVCVFRLSAH